MTIGMGLYALVISFLLLLSAVVAEWLLEHTHRPSRWVWAAALSLSVLLPTLPASPNAIRHPVLVQARSTVGLDQSTAVPVASEAPNQLSAPPLPAWTSHAIPGNLLRFSSLIVATLLLTAWTLLVLRSRRWQAGSLDGHTVLIAPSTGPAVFGFIRPRIVVPQWAFNLPEDDRRMLLAHERSHIDARDPLFLLLAGIVIVLMPWNPLLWFGVRRLRGAIEIDCDRRVLAAGTSPARYAECLVESASRMVVRGVPVGSLALSSSFLERRIALMQHRIRLTRSSAMVAVLLTGALVLMAFVTERPVPVSTSQALVRTTTVKEESTDRIERYYTRLTTGKLANPAILYDVFNADFSLRRQSQNGEGC